VAQPVRSSRIIFVSIADALGALERAVAFAEFSRGCEDPLKHKVHFEPKSAFEEVALCDHPKTQLCV
jgi:hypothetical protein